MSKREVRVKISDGGRLSLIYSDELAGLLAKGATVPDTRRVSHVEPAAGGGWAADMSPVDGPVLGPFTLRQEALDAELGYLREHLGL